MEEGITDIDNGALPKNKLEQIQLPSTLTKIADSLFFNAPNLKKVYPTAEGWNPPEAAVILTERIESIGNNAFNGCSSLEGEVRLPEALTSI